jgi:zinc-ribbon domain
MRPFDCKECGKKISSQANSCPNCGAPVKENQRSSAWRLKLILLAIAITLLIGFFGKPANKSPVGNQSEETPGPAVAEGTKRPPPVKIREGSTSYVAAREEDSLLQAFAYARARDRAGVDKLVELGKIFPIRNGASVEVISMHYFQKTAKVRFLDTGLELWVPLEAIQLSQ